MAAPIRVAFFGNGFTRSTILPCLRHVEGLRLVGLASPNQERARETARLFAIEEVAADHREILARTAPDLVFVVSPPYCHLEQTLDALRTGCHVVCEKPTAMNGGESGKMLAEARSRPGQIAWIDHELRFDPRRLQMLQWIREGRIGEPLRASYVLHSPTRRNPDLPWTWWSDEARGGGALGALGSHAIDALRSTLGDVQMVRAVLHTAVKTRRDPETGRDRGVTADDFAGAWLRFRSGALASLEVSVIEGERRHEMSIAGRTGSIHLREQGALRAAFGAEGPLEDHTPREDLPSNRDLAIPDTDWARSFLRLARALVQSIQEGTVSPIAANFHDGHHNQRVLDAIRRSAEDGGWTELREEAS